MGRSCSQNGRGRSAFKILTGKPTGKKSLGRLRCRWEDNIRMTLKEIFINARNWVESAQDRVYWRLFESSFEVIFSTLDKCLTYHTFRNDLLLDIG